ncbi:MAG: hypothetical protein A3J38_05010 [Gammaproteobacteria bacterium RIFCSPHIGHO2_12_FULL_45_9]|nr:MAG: hypothetical protein A3J38_05010 [Gammaproteobacteria bacterium RIFCSPHIGHO2_12_FULL_45_9]
MPKSYDYIVVMKFIEVDFAPYRTKRGVTSPSSLLTGSDWNPDLVKAYHNPNLPVTQTIYYERTLSSCNMLRTQPMPELALLTTQSKLMIVGHGSADSQQIGGFEQKFWLSNIAMAIRKNLRDPETQFTEEHPLHITLFACQGGISNTPNYAKNSMAGRLLHDLKSERVIAEISARTSNLSASSLSEPHHEQQMRGYLRLTDFPASLTLQIQPQSFKTAADLIMRPVNGGYGKRLIYCWKNGVATIYDAYDYKNSANLVFDTGFDMQKEAAIETILDQAATLEGEVQAVNKKFIGLLTMVSHLEHTRSSSEMIQILQAALNNPLSAVNQHTSPMPSMHGGETNTSKPVQNLIQALRTNTPIARLQ